MEEAFEVPTEEVKARAVRGVVAIMGRGFFIQFVAQISQFFLLAFLSVEQMGVFWIVSAVVGFLVFFSDIGLAAALIQKKEKPTEEDLRTTFTVQQILIILLLILLYFLTPHLRGLYHLSDEGVILLYALGFSLFLSSLKSIPSVLLERRLEFSKFIIPDLLESLVYSLTAVFLAWRGFGITSFTYAVVLRGIVGVFAIYLLSPWVPGFAFSKKSLGALFKFGVPYQVNQLIAVAKDRGVTLALGAVIGTSGVGYLGTAERASQIPLRQFLDPITKVSFPAFARMQSREGELANSVTRSLMFITFLVFPAAVGIWLTAPLIIKVVPGYARWEPSLVPLGFMTINVLFAAVTTQLTNMLSAIGKIKTVSKLIAMWAVLTIVLVPALGHLYGINGAALGYALVSSTSVIAIAIAKSYVNFSLTKSVVKTAFATIVMALVVLVARRLSPPTLPALVTVIALGALSYLAASYVVFGASLIADAKKFGKSFLNINR
ncbi:MAG: oligosaccharide flippase family protein [Candidatus Bathyarchaeia archaeon]